MTLSTPTLSLDIEMRPSPLGVEIHRHGVKLGELHKLRPGYRAIVAGREVYAGPWPLAAIAAVVRGAEERRAEGPVAEAEWIR